MTSSYLSSLGVAIAAYSALLPRRIDSLQDFETLEELVRQVPSEAKQTQVWGDLAERLYTYGRIDKCKQIAAQHIRPLLDRVKARAAGTHADVLIFVAPALYCASPVAIKEDLRGLDVQRRDEAIMRICEFLIRKCPLSDPYSPLPGHAHDITYENILELIDLMSLMVYDSYVYHFISAIADSVDLSGRHDRFTQQQRQHIARMLDDLVRAKLPAARFIRHDGYQIIALGQVARVRKDHSSTWDDLVKRAQSIPDIADQAYVLSVLRTIMPSREVQRHTSLLTDAEALIARIPAIYDRIGLLVAIAKMLWPVDKRFSKELSKIAFSSSAGSDSPDIARLQRDLVDFAHRMEPEFATKLASALDDDPARVHTRHVINERLKVLEVKQKMLDVGDSSQLSATGKSCAEAAWLCLGTLNARRSESLKPAQLRRFLRISASLPLGEAYPILAWAVGNLRVRYSSTDQASSILRPIFEATVLACRVAARMISKTPPTQRTIDSTLGEASGAQFIRSGEREKAMAFIRSWLEQKGDTYLKICDPYFGLEDLEVLRLVLAIRPELRIRILTSVKHQVERRVPQPYDVAFRDFWRVKISEQHPPDTEIVLAGLEGSNSLPIHDRWWLTAGSGLRMGTSLQSIGVQRDSEISILSEIEARNNEADVDRFLNRAEREHQGRRLQYTLFTL